MAIEHKNAWRGESQTVDSSYYIWLKTAPQKEENKILISYIKIPVAVIWKAAVFYSMNFISLKTHNFMLFIFLRTQYQFN